MCVIGGYLSSQVEVSFLWLNLISWADFTANDPFIVIHLSFFFLAPSSLLKCYWKIGTVKPSDEILLPGTERKSIYFGLQLQVSLHLRPMHWFHSRHYNTVSAWITQRRRSGHQSWMKTDQVCVIIRGWREKQEEDRGRWRWKETGGSNKQLFPPLCFWQIHHSPTLLCFIFRFLYADFTTLHTEDNRNRTLGAALHQHHLMGVDKTLPWPCVQASHQAKLLTNRLLKCGRCTALPEGHRCVLCVGVTVQGLRFLERGRSASVTCCQQPFSKSNHMTHCQQDQHSPPSSGERGRVGFCSHYSLFGHHYTSSPVWQKAWHFELHRRSWTCQDQQRRAPLNDWQVDSCRTVCYTVHVRQEDHEE